MRTVLAFTAAASLALLAVTSDAAEKIVSPPAGSSAATAAPQPPPITPSPSAATASDKASQVHANGPPILLETGKGSLIRLPKPAATVFIANPDVADVQIKTPTLIYVAAKMPGETVLYAVDAEDHVLLNSPVRVDHDLARVRETLGTVAPGENVKVSSVDNSLVLSGNISSAGRAERVRSLAAAIASETKGTVVNRMAVATPNQVNIRVKIAEVNRSVLKALGVNWEKLAGNIQFATQNPTTGGQITNQNVLQLALGGHAAQAFTMLDALAQEGLLTTLAEPNLTATNGQPASFLAGGEFPIPVASTGVGNAQTITVDFKTFGVSLDVTPTIIDAEHLNLKIRPEVSELTNNGAVTISGFSIPALTVRRAETTVELGSGESFMLGGLMENTSTQNISKIPALGDIPIIGQLFRSQQFQTNETELVIIVTPYLVKPTMTSIALPTDGYVLPHDASQAINGGSNRQSLPAPPRGPIGSGGQGLVGPAGFRLD
ncbi:MAG TPA: type II and III secretion system protein family protein [Stellaceae bacterium]|nr:type II and III secretion system protein family protein [Stellaceae bacterium]